MDFSHPYWKYAEKVNGRLAMIGVSIINAIPPGTRDLVEFSFFLAVGVTAGSLGLLS